MPKTCYVPKKFKGDRLQIVHQANEILEEYAAQGFVLTLRQLYYQFVARDLIPNTLKSYKRLGDIVGDARLAGKIDWNHLEDRTRGLAVLEHFDGPKDALTKLAGWYHEDMWARQEYRPEVWIEKDALVGVIQRVCEDNDVPYFSCRGYASLSEMWRASLRLRRWLKKGQSPYIIHFGDHDPSGIDMSRDITDRLRHTFLSQCQFNRVALNMDQIEEFKPPPNPAKVTDPRAEGYIRKYGTESWELDALEPTKFREIIEAELDSIRDDDLWRIALERRAAIKTKLTTMADEFEGFDDDED